MSLEPIYPKGFVKKLTGYCRSNPALKPVVAKLLTQMPLLAAEGKPLGKGCEKFRVVVKHNNTNPGSRYIILTKTEGQKIYFLTIYDKAEREHISDADVMVIVDYLLRHEPTEQ